MSEKRQLLNLFDQSNKRAKQIYDRATNSKRATRCHRLITPSMQLLDIKSRQCIAVLG
jgi:hypothetical protein